MSYRLSFYINKSILADRVGYAVGIVELCDYARA